MNLPHTGGKLDDPRDTLNISTSGNIWLQSAAFLAGTLLVMLVFPWLVRFFTWLDLGDMYERYAKWACQC